MTISHKKLLPINNIIYLVFSFMLYICLLYNILLGIDSYDVLMPSKLSEGDTTRLNVRIHESGLTWTCQRTDILIWKCQDGMVRMIL